jgi:hypothetical protein
MKLIIDIPEYAYKHIREYYEKNDIVESTYSYIYHGIPIPDNATICEWIPMTKRPMTEDEKEHYKEALEYCDDAEVFDCKLPEYGEEVLITMNEWVTIDTFYRDFTDGCAFEGYDIDDVEAWMPLPEPYQKGGKE